MIRSIFLLVSLAVSHYAVSDVVRSAVDGAKIKSVLAGDIYGKVVFVEVEPKPTTVPECQQNTNYNYAFDR